MKKPTGSSHRQTLTIIGLLTSLLTFLGLYHFRRHILGRGLKIGAPAFPVAVTRRVRVPAARGAGLIADHYAPVGERLFPTILIRTPYGRDASAGVSGWLSAFAAQRFAERGYNVIVQDVRGRFDSFNGEEFNPFRYEAEDGRATLAWIEAQPWFNGILGMWGASYLGYTQWAVAPGSPLTLKALFPVFSGTKLPIAGIRDHSFGADMLLRWIQNLAGNIPQPASSQPQTPISKFRTPNIFRSATRYSQLTVWLQERRLRQGVDALPLRVADRRMLGREVRFFQDWLDHPDLNDEYWRTVTPADRLGQVTAAVHLMGGWYDIMLRETLEDYAALKRHGRTPCLTIGPWSHLDPAGALASLRLGIEWFDAILIGNRSRLRREPVRVFVMGAQIWSDLPAWPPPAEPHLLYLSDTEYLATQPPAGDSPDEFVYDPSDPTPSFAGSLMSPHAGQRDNRRLEARPDVLVYTSDSLAQKLTVMGSASVTLYVRSSLEHTDFFVRLCDVQKDGRSLNVADGFIRVTPGVDQRQGDGVLKLIIPLWPTAYQFQAGHRIRLQVSSGAHPRFSRNTGDAQPLAQAAHLKSAHQTIFHDDQHRSAISLPVV